MRSIKPTTIRLDDEDIRMVEIVKRKYGQSSLIGALRVALRIAAEQTIHKTIHKHENNTVIEASKKDAIPRPNAGAGEEI